MLSEKIIHLCVTGGIAAYKAVELTRALQKAGAAVRVAMTQNAEAFIAPLTFQAISKHPVLRRTLDPAEEMEIGHIAFAQNAEALIVAPATANIIAKAACGIADDLISTVLLAATCPVIIAPAMNQHMYASAALQRNLEILRERGFYIVPPDSGELACGQSGPGRLSSSAQILEHLNRIFQPQILKGRHILISAGPTREWIDPVRFLSNPSSGLTGFLLAEAARQAGAEVSLVHGPVSLPPPTGVRMIPVVTAQEMYAAIMTENSVDAIVMSAAVADWRPADPKKQKQRKQEEPMLLKLCRNPDILAALGARRGEERHPLLLGFAAQTGDPQAAAQEKLRRKGVDLIVANDVSEPGCGFGVQGNRVWLVSEEGIEALPHQSKAAIAHRLVTWIGEHLQ